MRDLRKDGSRNYRCGASWASRAERAAWEREDTLDPAGRLVAQRMLQRFALDDLARFALAQARRVRNQWRAAGLRSRAKRRAA